VVITLPGYVYNYRLWYFVPEIDGAEDNNSMQGEHCQLCMSAKHHDEDAELHNALEL